MKTDTFSRKIVEIIQVNGVTNMVADFKLTHMRVLMSIIKSLQDPLTLKLRSRRGIHAGLDGILPPVTVNDFGLTRKITISVSELGVGKNNMYYLVRCLDELRRTTCVFPRYKGTPDRPTKIGYMFSGLITHYYIEPYSGKVELYLLDDMVRRLLLTEEGYMKYNISTAMAFNNKYTVRMYWLICSWRQRSGFVISIENLRRLMSSEDKYLRTDNFMRVVIDRAYRELKENSNIYFEYRKAEMKGKQYLCVKVKTVMTEEEKERKKSQAYDLVYGIMHYLGVSDRTVIRLLGKVELDDVPAFCRKLAEVKDIIKERRDIRDIDQYVATAMSSWLDDWSGRYEEIAD